MHDLEMIMALAEGSLTDSAEAAARAEIAACQECAYDLELQMAALDALRSIPHASLTEFEATKMQRAVRQELGLTRAKVEPDKAARRRMPLAAFATAAAVLLAVVVVGPTLDFIGDGGGANSDATLGAAAPAESTLPTAQIDAQPEATIDRLAESATGGSVTSTSTKALVPAADDKLYGYYRTSPDLGSLRQTFIESGLDEDLVRSEALRDAGDSYLEEAIADSQACVSITITSDANFIRGFQVARGELDGRQVIYVVYLAEDLEESALIVHAADNCEELARAGP